MPFEVPKTAYSGRIREVSIGTGAKAVTVGGETSFPFYLFEGKMPRRPAIAMEVYDTPPTDWPEAAVKPFQDVLADPAAWAKKCARKYGADMVCLQLAGTDPNGLNRTAAEAVKTVQSVTAAVDVPLLVWGTASREKDAAMLTAAAAACPGRRFILGPVEEANHREIGTAAVKYGHIAAASTPIDINLAKQLNILLGNLGVPENSLVMDTSVSGIGYGIEYCYSVMERCRIAALTQGDAKLQAPVICNLAKETWKTKEARPLDDPAMGDAERRGILLEAMTAVMLLLAGGDILIMRHPRAVSLVKEMIDELSA